MRKLPANAAEDLLEIVMRRYERTSTILTSNRPLDDWPKLFGDTPAVAAFLDRLMHHAAPCRDSRQKLPAARTQPFRTQSKDGSTSRAPPEMEGVLFVCSARAFSKLCG